MIRNIRGANHFMKKCVRDYWDIKKNSGQACSKNLNFFQELESRWISIERKSILDSPIY